MKSSCAGRQSDEPRPVLCRQFSKSLFLLVDGSPNMPIFLYAKDAEPYQKFLQEAEIKVRGSRILPMKSQEKHFNNMRLRHPEEITLRGWSRCILVDNLPVSTTVEGLKRDLKKVIGVELDYEKFEVKGILARLWTTRSSKSRESRQGFGLPPLLMLWLPRTDSWPIPSTRRVISPMRRILVMRTS
jgi:hypothetical protein